MNNQLLLCLAIFLAVPGPGRPAESSSSPNGAPVPGGNFRKVILDQDREVNGQLEDTLKDPMELAVAGDGRVFYAQRDGTIKVWKPDSKTTVVIGAVPVFTGLEDGMLGMTLDPDFLRNGWIYLMHSLPETALDAGGKKVGTNRVSRFTVQGDLLEAGSEKVLIDIATQREQCCHSGGSLAFDAQGNLFISAGDNTNPFDSDGYSPSDERPDRSPWDAQKSSANANDLRGKILRIRPKPEGGYDVPEGNLFKPGTPGTRPEVYVMGNRNPFRISLDRRTGNLYWGEVGPDAGGFKEGRGPAGHDEINQARAAGNFGWPHFVGDNKAYWRYDFAAKTSGDRFDPAKPINSSPNNTGIKELPPAQPALIYYPSGPSTRFPMLGSGGRTAMAGPVYYFDPNLKSAHKLPAEYDRTLFFYEWSRDWIMTARLDGRGQVEKISPFIPPLLQPKGSASAEEKAAYANHPLYIRRPMDMELGPDGCLYIIEWGKEWGNNKDTKIVRIEHLGDAP